MIKIEASVSKGWLHQHGGFNFTEQYYNDPLFRRAQDHEINALVRKEFPRFAIYNMEANLVQAKYVKENHVPIGAIQPNMILATVLGASFLFQEDKDSDVLGRPLENITSKAELPAVEAILDHPLIKDLAGQMEMVSEKHPELKVIPPFFWDESGRATIHGIITTSLKLTGDNIMVMMMTDPDLAHAIHQWITDAYILLIRYFAALGNLTISSVHVGECAGTMISSQLYEEFVVPYINRLGDTLGPVRLHSCGISDHLIPAVSRIENLKIIDTGSETSISMIREMMGNEFEINLAPPFEILREGVSESEVLHWLDKTLADNEGGPLQIAYHIEPDYKLLNCLIIHEELERRGMIINERLY
jgi:hypothetical protein